MKVLTQISASKDALPLREQVEVQLRDWLTEGRYKAGDQLPSAREISELCGINDQTVRRAIKRLIEEGLLYGAQGKGIFVRQSSVRHHRIALVLPNLEDEMTLHIAKGARKVLDEAGFQTLILDARRDCDEESNHLASLPDLPVDGAIVFPVAYGDITERIVRLKGDGFPLVLVDKHCPGVAVDCVVADAYTGAYELTSALVKKGYQRVAWLGGEAGSTTVEEHLEGYRWALGDQGLPVSRSLVRRLKQVTPTSPYEEAVAQELDALLAMPEPPEALVCVNDLQAVAALAHVQNKGLRVPEDLAIAGFDDLGIATTTTPPLTTVHKPIEEMGQKAAELLVRRITKKDEPVHVPQLPTKLIFRQST